MNDYKEPRTKGSYDEGTGRDSGGRAVSRKHDWLIEGVVVAAALLAVAIMLNWE